MTAGPFRRRLAILITATLAALGVAVATPATGQAAPALPGPFDDSFYLPPTPIQDRIAGRPATSTC